MHDPTLVVDANVIFAACLGGRTFSLFQGMEGKVELSVTIETLERVKEIAPLVAVKRGVDLVKMLTILESLPLQSSPEHFYKQNLNLAQKLIGQRDRNDLHLLALVLELRTPIWTNDKDFQIPEVKKRVKVYTTEDLLRFQP